MRANNPIDLIPPHKWPSVRPFRQHQFGLNLVKYTCPETRDSPESASAPLDGYLQALIVT